MKLDPQSAFSSNIVQEIPADPVWSFVLAHHEGFWNAARFLGGHESARLVDRCVELLAQVRRATPRTEVMLDQTLAVLSLERVDDPGETGPVAGSVSPAVAPSQRGPTAGDTGTGNEEAAIGSMT